MSTFGADEQRVILMALGIMLVLSAARIFPVGAPAPGVAPPATSIAAEPLAETREIDTERPDPNEASLERLLRVPGMTGQLANAILKHRSNNILLSPADLAAIPGVRPADALAATSGLAFPGSRPPPRGADGSRLDLNRATPAQLEQLPGVGPQTARAILERRRLKPFSDLEELLALPGIGPGKLEQLSKLLAIGPAQPAPKR